ncbi:MAG: hypothetical protein R6W90_04555 [Ignavibacteriaceae bacterium]
MKLLRVTITLFFTFFISFLLYSQDINVHNTIGQKKAAVVKQFGNPVHQDNSSPSMMCMFYKGSNYNMTFVSDNEGVYQAEVSASYANEAKARSAVDAFISGSLSNGYSVDTVTVNDFHLKKTGVKVDLQMAENKLSKKFDIRVKATR